MEQANLEAQTRLETGKNKIKKVRRSGFIPAVIYTKGEENIILKLNASSFSRVLSTKAGLNVIINLFWNENEKTISKSVITQEIQRNALTDKIIHVDFHGITLTDELETKIPIAFIGEAPGIKNGGIVIHGLREVEIKCLPTDIPSHIEIDISSLELGKNIHVSDLITPPKISILTAGDEIIASCVAPKIEEEKAEVTAEAVVVEGEAKVEGEAAPAEGAEVEAKAKTPGEAKAKTPGTDKSDKSKVGKS
jgi:large subunit ribosomal protein L25